MNYFQYFYLVRYEKGGNIENNRIGRVKNV